MEQIICGQSSGNFIDSISQEESSNDKSCWDLNWNWSMDWNSPPRPHWAFKLPQTIKLDGGDRKTFFSQWVRKSYSVCMLHVMRLFYVKKYVSGKFFHVYSGWYFIKNCVPSQRYPVLYSVPPHRNGVQEWQLRVPIHTPHHHPHPFLQWSVGLASALPCAAKESYQSTRMPSFQTSLQLFFSYRFLCNIPKFLCYCS